jgi:hypothetical protein
MLILAVDPSVKNVGFALTCGNGKIVTCLHHPLEIPRNNPLRLQSIAGDILNRLHLLLAIYQYKKITHLVIEYPQFENSVRGEVAARQGYTLDLAYVCGEIVRYCALHTSNVRLPTPLQWKGNRPKKATELEVQKKFGMLQISEHEYDACGLLLWGLEEMKLF